MDEAGQYWLGNPEFGNVQRETIHGGKETKWRMMICFHGIFAQLHAIIFLLISIWFHFLFRPNKKTWIWRGTNFSGHTHNRIKSTEILFFFFLLSVKGSPSSAVFFILSFLDYYDYYASPNVRYHTDQELQLLYIIHTMTDYPPLGEIERRGGYYSVQLIGRKWMYFSWNENKNNIMAS